MTVRQINFLLAEAAAALGKCKHTHVVPSDSWVIEKDTAQISGVCVHCNRILLIAVDSYASTNHPLKAICNPEFDRHCDKRPPESNDSDMFTMPSPLPPFRPCPEPPEDDNYRFTYGKDVLC